MIDDGYNHAGYITAGCEQGGVDDDYSVGERQELCIAHGAGPGGKQTHRVAMLNENKGGRLHCSGAVQSHHGAVLNVNKGETQQWF